MREKVNIFLAYILLVINVLSFIIEVKVLIDGGGERGYGYLFVILLLFIHPTLIPAIITLRYKNKRDSKGLLIFNVLAILYLFIIVNVFIK